MKTGRVGSVKLNKYYNYTAPKCSSGESNEVNLQTLATHSFL